MALGPKPRSLFDRATGRYEKADSGCWEWTASNDGRGYGVVWYRGRLQKAHRAFYMESIGEIPDGMDLCHSCDNRACVNPAHMFVGSRLENMQDCVRKGRFPRGVHSHKTTIGPEKAALIREDPRSYREISAHYGVSMGSITKIKKYGAWK